MAETGTTVITLGDDNLKEFVLCDAVLLGIAWVEHQPDLQIRIRTGDKRLATLACTWAGPINIGFKNLAGTALSWRANFKREGQRWRMIFDFASKGFIELICSEVRLTYHEVPAPIGTSG